MPIEYKSIKAVMMGIQDRTVTGIFCVHGNVDAGDGWSYRDRSHPGLFGDFTADGRKRAVFLWQHNSYDPPTATIDRLFEVMRADLPPAVLKYAPDATGGVGVSRTYDTDDYSDRIFRKIQSGALTEMSYAYEARRFDFEKPTDGGDMMVRNLYEADLYDVSDVNWGMNPATSSDGSKGRPLQIEHATVLAAVKAYTDRYQQLSELRAKEGRVLSGENRKRIEAAIEALDAATKTLADLLAATESPKTGWAETHQLRGRWLEQQQRLRELGVPL